MQPNDQQPQYAIDYLDSISTVPKKSGKGVNNMLFFGVLIGGVLIALAVGVFALLNSGSSQAEDISRLMTRLENLQGVVDSSRKNIVNNKLRGVNTSLSLALTNANNGISEPVAAIGLDPSKLPPVRDSTADDVLTELENARLNAVHDRTYAREMNYQLETLIVLMGDIEAETKSRSLKEFLNTTTENLTPISKQFAEFNATTS